MLQTYEAIVNNGQITTWLDNPPITNNAKVYITFVENDLPQMERKLGFMRGEIQMPDENSRYDLSKTGEQRWGFLEGQTIIPNDINFGDDEIMRMFGFSEEEIAQTYPNKARLTDGEQK